MTYSFLPVVIIITLMSLPLKAADSEAFVVQGSIGSLSGSVYDLTDTQYKPTGTVSYLRFHLPVFQTTNTRVRLSLSNHYLDTENNSEVTADQINHLSSTGIGLGFNVQWRFLIIGAEYQQNRVRQLIVGTNTVQRTYTLNMPLLYAGLRYKFGNLGIGVSYLYKKANVTTEQSGLSENRPFDEKITMLDIYYYFPGNTKKFFKDLFVD